MAGPSGPTPQAPRGFLLSGRGGAILVTALVVLVILAVLVVVLVVLPRLLAEPPEMAGYASAEPGSLIFDYYCGATGLPDGEAPRYDEITLTAVEDPDKVRLDVYSHPGGAGGSERHTAYLVSADAIRTAMKLVHKYDMPNWDKYRDEGPTGTIYVCKFYWGDKLCRATSEQMPPRGSSAFSAVHAALSGYIDPQLQLTDPTDPR